MDNITIYTDGSCRGNPGPGGWGLIVVDNETNTPIEAASGTNESTTNNEMEITAIVTALKRYGVDEDSFHYPVIYTDSSYAFKTFTEWMQGWKRNGWKRPKNQPIANLELIQLYDELWENGKRIELRWVRGHNGNRWNEIADKLATGKISVGDINNEYFNLTVKKNESFLKN